MLHVKLVSDILIFSADYENVIRVLLNKLVDNLAAVGSQLNYRRKLDMPPPKKNYLFSRRDLALAMGKYDHSVPVSLDHRRVHGLLQFCVRKRQKCKKCISCKNWRPQLDCADAPTQQQNHIRQHLQTTSRANADTLVQPHEDVFASMLQALFPNLIQHLEY